jgi:Fe-S-cluster containining protein
MIIGDKIAAKARKSISTFCIEECKAYCCRKSYLIMNEKEMITLTKGHRTSLEAEQLLKTLKDGKYSFFLGDKDHPCPCLSADFRCSIHRKINRPKVCKEYPIFIRGDKVLISPRCLAYKTGMFYPYIRQFKMAGYKIPPSTQWSDTGLDKLSFID